MSVSPEAERQRTVVLVHPNACASRLIQPWPGVAADGWLPARLMRRLSSRYFRGLLE
jgi:hypothetical protein